MKLDASREFEAITKYIDHIKTTADLVSDYEVLFDLMMVLAQLMANMYRTIPIKGPSGEESKSFNTLCKQKYDDLLKTHGLQRIMEDWRE